MVENARPKACFLFQPGLSQCVCQRRELRRVPRKTKPISEPKNQFPLKRHILASTTGGTGKEGETQDSGRIWEVFVGTGWKDL